MDEKDNRNLVAVEFFIGLHVLCGQLSIATGRRLLDILNRSSDFDRDIQSDYVEFMSEAGTNGDESGKVRYVRKMSVELAALSEPNLARGAGAKALPGVYPRVEKAKVYVSLETPIYSLYGNMHCASGRTVRDVLDERTLFLPLTDVSIEHDKKLYGTRPFVAIKKEQIISLKEEKTD